MNPLQPLQSGQLQLLSSFFQQRQQHSLPYVLSLDSTKLLRPYLLEAEQFEQKTASGRK